MDGEWVRSRDGCIRWTVVIVEGEGAVLGVNLGCPDGAVIWRGEWGHLISSELN